MVLGLLSLWDNPNLPGLSLASGTVPKSWDCPRLLGLWDWEITPMVLRLWVFGTVLTFRDFPGLLGKSQSPGTVPKSRDCPKVPGLSQAFGTVPKNQSPTCLRFDFSWNSLTKNKSPWVSVHWVFGTVPKSKDCPGLLGHTQIPGTVKNLKILYCCLRKNNITSKENKKIF